jgi:hypothetical protein
MAEVITRRRVGASNDGQGQQQVETDQEPSHRVSWLTASDNDTKPAEEQGDLDPGGSGIDELMAQAAYYQACRLQYQLYETEHCCRRRRCKDK